MRIEIPDQLEQKTVLHGTVNDEPFKMTGGGRGRPHDGTISTDLQTNPGPVRFSMGVMAPCVVMGFPTFSRYEPGTHDLFKISDGYTYERHLTFPGGGELKGRHTVKYVGDRGGDGLRLRHVEGDFEVNGDVHAPVLVSVEPVEEHFEPAGKGVINSHFTIVWRTADGDRYTATSRNVYHLNHDQELPAAHVRRIEFDSQYTPTSLRQAEKLVVRLA